MPSEIGSVTSRDGITLRTRAWAPSAPPWAGMLLVHGLGEHSGRYERTGSILAAAGIHVHGWDHRGFGASGGTPCHIERWESLLDDVDEALERLRAAAGDRPVVMLGHSMGGLIALDQATSGRPTSDLLILSAPSLADSLAPWKHRAAPWLDPLLPRLRLPSGIRPQDVSCDPAQAAADAADPLIRQAGTVHLARIGFDAQRRVSERLATLERMPMPTLVIHGSDGPRRAGHLDRSAGTARWGDPAGAPGPAPREPQRAGRAGRSSPTWSPGWGTGWRPGRLRPPGAPGQRITRGDCARRTLRRAGVESKDNRIPPPGSATTR